MAESQINVSIIIPNLNSPTVDRTLDALRAQEFDLSTVEVLVVGLDEPGLVVEDELVSRVITDGPATPSEARNIGLRSAQGELLCLIDADCVPDSYWLANLTKRFSDSEYMAVGGGIAFGVGAYWTLADNISWFHPYLAQKDVEEQAILPSLNMCVRRCVVDDVGFFNESYPKAAGEDAEWTTRIRQAGYALHFQTDAVIRHEPSRTSFEAAMAHAFKYGRYSVKINPQFIDFLDTPAFLTKWWSVLLLSPALAAGVTARAYLSNRRLWRYWYTAPAVFVSKLFWCFGLATTLRQGGPLAQGNDCESRE